MADKKKGRPKAAAQPKQPDLNGIEGEGVAHVRIPEVDEAAASYVRFRDRRMELTKKEVESKDKLIEVMHENEDKIGKDASGAMRYVFDETEVILRPTGEELKVKAYVDPGAPE